MCPFAHDHTRLPLPVLNHDHIPAHVVHLLIVQVNQLPRSLVQRWACDLFDNMLLLGSVTDGVGAEDYMVT